MIDTRPMSPSDRNYVVATWLKDMCRVSRGKQHDYYDAFRPAVEGIVDSKRIIMACSAEHPTTIAGWICVDQLLPINYWMYVPHDLKNGGIEEKLTKHFGPPRVWMKFEFEGGTYAYHAGGFSHGQEASRQT